MAIGLAGKKIITQGLGVNYKACQGIITTHFSLYCVPIEQPPAGGGGGPYPGDAWNKFDTAQDIFQPVDTDRYDPEKTFKIKQRVVIRIDFKNFHTEKIYLVPIERARIIIKVANMFNVTRDMINVSVKKVTRVLHNIKIAVFNLRRKD